MQSDELLAEDAVHGRDVVSVCPERIVNCREHDIFLLALKRRVHHVGGIEGVDKVGWEGAVLFLLIYRLVIQVLHNGEILDYSANDVPF